MAYRNGTYIAFHGNDTANPAASDFKYYSLLRAWHVREESDFEFINSHEKNSMVRDNSLRSTLYTRLANRLANSKNMVLIIGNTTRFDTDTVLFEIRYAIDRCKIPIIVAYTNYTTIMAPQELSHLWPQALSRRINNGTARVIHIPFKQKALKAAVNQFHLNNLPEGGLIYYTRETHANWGYISY